MILYVRAENYRSIGKQQELNLFPGSDKSHKRNIIDYEKEQGLSAIPIYGGNATGKTNILKVIKTLKKIITLDKDIKEYYEPCEFTDEDNIHLELIFFKDNIKYYYAIKYNDMEILEERLYYYPKLRITKIFDRNEEKPYGTKFEKMFKKYGDDTPKSISMLRFLATWLKGNEENIDRAFNFFSNDIITLNLGEEPSIKESIKHLRSDENHKKFKEFIEFFYTHLNVGAKGIRISNALKNISNYDLQNLTKDMLDELIKANEEPKLELMYEVNGKEIFIDIENESKGMQKIFTMGRFFADALCNDKVVVFDELEISFHPILSRKIIELFFEEKTNAQLIFTTHDTNLLDLKLFRRDQIYFTERTAKTGFQTNIKSLAELPNIRKTTDIEKAYLQGNYCDAPLEKNFPLNELLGDLQ